MNVQIQVVGIGRRRDGRPACLIASLSWRRLAVLIATLVFIPWACAEVVAPTPEPAPSPAPRPHHQPGAGQLLQLSVSVPNAVGTTVTWSGAQSFVSLTSASPSQIVAGDAFTLWGSSTASELTAPASGFIARRWAGAVLVCLASSG